MNESLRYSANELQTFSGLSLLPILVHCRTPKHIYDLDVCGRICKIIRTTKLVAPLLPPPCRSFEWVNGGEGIDRAFLQHKQSFWCPCTSLLWRCLYPPGCQSLWDLCYFMSVTTTARPTCIISTVAVPKVSKWNHSLVLILCTADNEFGNPLGLGKCADIELWGRLLYFFFTAGSHYWHTHFCYNDVLKFNMCVSSYLKQGGEEWGGGWDWPANPNKRKPIQISNFINYWALVLNEKWSLLLLALAKAKLLWLLKPSWGNT